MIRNRHLDTTKPKALQAKFEGPYLVLMKCHKNVYLIQSVFDPKIQRKVNIRLIEHYYNTNYQFLETNPLPEKYLADIKALQTDYQGDSENSSDETEIYYHSDKNQKSNQNIFKSSNKSDSEMIIDSNRAQVHSKHYQDHMLEDSDKSDILSQNDQDNFNSGYNSKENSNFETETEIGSEIEQANSEPVQSTSKVQIPGYVTRIGRPVRLPNKYKDFHMN